MKKLQRPLFFILLGPLLAGSLELSLAAENAAGPVTDSLLQRKDLLGLQWEALDKAFNAALSARGSSREDLAKCIADRKTLSDRADAWNKQVLRAGLFLPRSRLDASGDEQRVRDYFDFWEKAASMEKAADRPMSLEKADAALSELAAWNENGKISVAFFLDLEGKIKARGRESADLVCRQILDADLMRAQALFDENEAALKRYLSARKYGAIRGIAMGYAARTRAAELPDSVEGNPPDSAARNLALAQARSDSAARAQDREKQAAFNALTAKQRRDEAENDRVLFLSRACAAMDTLKDAEGVRNTAGHFLNQCRQHGADAGDRLALEERRDRKVRELDSLAAIAREAEAIRQNAEKERRRLLSGADKAIAGKRYEEATALVGEYRLAGGDTAIAGDRMNRITTQRNADIEAATRRLRSEAQDAQQRAFKAVKISEMQAEQRKIAGIPDKIKKTGADPVGVLSAVDTALNRVDTLLALAREGDSLKTTWQGMGKAFSGALSVSGTSPVELQLSSEERKRLSQSADAWNRRVALAGARLPRLYCDISGDAQAIRRHAAFCDKVAALKKESLGPVGFEKADALLSRVRVLSAGNGIQISGVDTIVSDIKARAGETAARTDSAISLTAETDPGKALAMLNKNAAHLEKYGSKKACKALREKISDQQHARETRRFLHARMAGFRPLLKRSDARPAEAALDRIDSAYKALKRYSGPQAEPYADSLDALHEALEARQEELEAIQRHKDSLRTAAAERISTIKAARTELYKARTSEEVRETMQYYLEKLRRMQAEALNPKAMKSLKEEIKQRTRYLVSREKAAAQKSRAKRKAR